MINKTKDHIEKDNILLFPIHPTSWNGMYQIALKIKENGKYEPIILVMEQMSERVKACEAKNIRTVLFGSGAPAGNFPGAKDGNISEQNKPEPGLESVLRFPVRVFLGLSKEVYRFYRNSLDKLYRSTNGKILNYSLYHIMRIPAEMAYYKFYISAINAVLDKAAPKAVYMYNDNGGGVFALFAKACKNRNIKIIIPVIAFQHQDIPAARRLRCRFLYAAGPGAPVINRIIKRYFPDQLYRYNGRDLVFYMPYELLAMDFAGILPPYPWVRGKNSCDIICVEDRYQRKRLLDLGVNSDRIRVTGHFDYDNLFRVKAEKEKADVYMQYGFRNDRKLIIIAVPQLIQEGDVKTPAEHWQDIEFFVTTSCKTGHNVLLALHPKVEKKDYLYLEKKYPAKVNADSTSEVIPFCDIYMSSGSSTMLWAVACSAVSINFGEIYGYKNEMFGYLKSIIGITKKEELWPVLNRLVNDEGYFSRMKDQAKLDYNEHFLPLDGNNFKRSISVLEETIQGAICAN